MNIALNQVGYLPCMEKKALIHVDQTQAGSEQFVSFCLIDTADQRICYQGSLSGPARNPASGEYLQTADFSDFVLPGTYILRLDNGDESPSFRIGTDVYDDLSRDLFDFYSLCRCGVKVIHPVFGHEACHCTPARLYGTDEHRDVTGGWHDAGDYGRYVVPGAKTVADLMMAWEDHGDPRDLTILNEVRYELDWMKKMQAPDGGVHHKVTCAAFPGFVMPEEEKDELILLPVSTTATGDFVAAMAIAARVYKASDPAYARSCLEAALKAKAYLDRTPCDPVGFKNPEDIKTGEYDDACDLDERFWAAAELYRTTGDQAYLEEASGYFDDKLNPEFGWADITLYGYYALACSVPDGMEAKEICIERMIETASFALEKSKRDLYGVSLSEDDYIWGSNMNVADNGMLFLTANRFRKDKKWIAAAQEQLSYILGCNATGYCFVTGFGTKPVRNPHHRPSAAKNTAQPGMLVGGPDSGLHDPAAAAALTGKAPAACYVDVLESYSTNEITIYWNSPLIYLIMGIQHTK